MEEKVDSNVLEKHFFELKDGPTYTNLNSHSLRSLSCTSRFFSSKLKGFMQQKPIWQIIAGYEQTFLLNSQTGELYGIGLNEYLSLGIAGYPIDGVQKIPLLEEIAPIEMFVSACQSFILSKDGKLFATGRNSSGELGGVQIKFEVSFRSVPLQKIKSIAVMNTITLFLTQDNQIYSTKDKYLKLPCQPIQQIEAGYSCAFILFSDMTLYEYAANMEPQVQLVDIPKDIEIKKIRAKGNYCLILTKDNQLYFVNKNKGDTFKPLALPKDVHIKNVYLGSEHIIIQSTDDKLFGYGRNLSGELGLGEGKAKVKNFEEISLPTESRVCYVVTGFSYTFVICENDEIYGFGNAHSQLGEKKGTCHYLPERISLIEDINTLKLSETASMRSNS